MSWSDNRAVDAVHWQILKNHLKPNVWPMSREMLKYKQELDSARHADLNQLASSVQEMKSKLSYLKKTASDVNKIKTVGFDKFRRDIKTFESKLSKLKEGSSKKLREESQKQTTLTEEIDQVKHLALQDGIPLKQHDITSKKKKENIKTVKRAPISKNTYASKEIAEFHDFCARNYGLTGGWSSKDHETFLKIRSKHADGVNFICHVVQAMPHISEGAALEHETWFVKFEELKSKQKEAIIRWKKDKKNVFLNECNPNVSKKSPCNDTDITWKVANDHNEHLEKSKNENNNIDEPQCEIEVAEPTQFSDVEKTITKPYREKDKKRTESKKRHRQRLDSERSDPVTIVTLHGRSEKYDDIEEVEKFPNVHFSIYGAKNQDVKVVLKYQ